jgi:hypothetical protein
MRGNTMLKWIVAGAIVFGIVVIAKKYLSKRELTYEEVMKYFIAHKNDKDEIVKGAILKESAGSGYKITQMFLDKNNKNVVSASGAILGRTFKVRSLDDELINLFKKEDLLIIG